MPDIIELFYYTSRSHVKTYNTSIPLIKRTIKQKNRYTEIGAQCIPKKLLIEALNFY